MSQYLDDMFEDDVVVLPRQIKALDELSRRPRPKRNAAESSEDNADDADDDEYLFSKTSITSATTKARLVCGDTDDAASSTESGSEASFQLSNAMASCGGLSRLRSVKSSESLNDECLSTKSAPVKTQRRVKRQRSFSSLSTSSAPAGIGRTSMVQEANGYESDPCDDATTSMITHVVSCPRLKLKPVSWC